MKREKLYDAITDVREDIIIRADARNAEKKPRRRRWPAAVAAVLVVAILGGILLHPGTSLVGTAYAVALAEYPEMAPYPFEEEYFDDSGNFDSKGYDAAWTPWREAQRAQWGPLGYADGLEDFFASSISTFLSGTPGENAVYSPLNVYMALAMLAETAGGDSRQQILDLLGHEDLDSLREQAGYLWNANYRDDGATTSILASSLWMNENVDYVQSTVDALAEHYYASVFQGEMGSSGYNEALQNWLNEQTGGLLKEYANEVTMDPQTVLALATTVYFQAQWSDKFNEDLTEKAVFHGVGGDVDCDFMNSSGFGMYYWGEKFSATCLSLDNAGAMYFILPDEGYTVDDLLADEQAMAFAVSPGVWENSQYVLVNLSLPKFDVSSNIDLKAGLQKLGVTDVFDETGADFTPLTPLAEREEVWVEKAEHAARVTVDEKGCTAAAYTVMLMLGGTQPPAEEVDFVLDRPFLFVLTGIDGLPLFVGVVNDP